MAALVVIVILVGSPPSLLLSSWPRVGRNEAILFLPYGREATPVVGWDDDDGCFAVSQAAATACQQGAQLKTLLLATGDRAELLSPWSGKSGGGPLNVWKAMVPADITLIGSSAAFFG